MNSKIVFELRNQGKELNGVAKVNKLNEALQIANNIYQSEPKNEWIQKAFAWVLIDLCKYHISINKLNIVTNYFQHLNSIEFNESDEIIENQKSFLRTKIDKNYSEIKKAEDLSKNNKHKEAISVFKQLISSKQLTEIHHETYGWVIYRYIKSDEKELTSIQVRTFLRDYMNLKNERPSLLHSMILNFALHYSKEHLDFNLYNFFKLWNPENLRPDDKSKQWFKDKEIPSLISRIFRVFIEQNYNIDIQYLLENVQITQTIDLLREPQFWQIFNAKKENKFSDLWTLFNNYNLQFSKFPKSKWHSEILSLAERFMEEADEWRFLEFFESWNPINFMHEDWEGVKKNENTYKALAIKCLKKSFNIIKSENKQTGSNEWLIKTYQVATSKYPKDGWINREKALLLIQNNDLGQAIEIYKNLVLSLGDKSYIWSEFSSCFDNNNNNLKIGMLSKAVLLEKNEAFLGDIHLELAKILTENNLIENAIIELLKYKNHREKKGWKLSDTYTSLNNKISNNQTSIKDNQALYEKYVPLAEEYAYQDINWSDFVLIDIWKDDKNKDRYTFSNGKETEFSIGKQRFKSIKKAEVGNVFKFKLHSKEKEVERIRINLTRTLRYSTPKIEYKYIPLLSKKIDKPNWSILEDEYAVIDFINKERKVIHAISSKSQELFFRDDISKYNINDFIKCKLLVTRRKGKRRVDLKKIEVIEAIKGIEYFSKKLVIVDNVNEDKKLFHFVADRTVQGIVKFADTDLRPKEGGFLEIWIAEKSDKKFYKLLKVIETEEKSKKLRTKVSGLLSLKYRVDEYTRNFEDLDENEKLEEVPNFGFISNFYVPGYILKKYSIISNCQVKCEIIFTGEKWKIIELERVG